MKKADTKGPSYIVSDDHDFELDMRIEESRALLFLLGVAVAKGPEGLLHHPTEIEQSGILCLVAKVGDDLSAAYRAAKHSDSPDAATVSTN